MLPLNKALVSSSCLLVDTAPVLAVPNSIEDLVGCCIPSVLELGMRLCAIVEENVFGVDVFIANMLLLDSLETIEYGDRLLTAGNVDSSIAITPEPVGFGYSVLTTSKVLDMLGLIVVPVNPFPADTFQWPIMRPVSPPSSSVMVVRGPFVVVVVFPPLTFAVVVHSEVFPSSVPFRGDFVVAVVVASWCGLIVVEKSDFHLFVPLDLLSVCGKGP